MADAGLVALATRRRRAAAALAAVAAFGAATIAATPAVAAPACREALPYGASASADLLRLAVLDLQPLGLPLGPVTDVRIASTGAGMAAESDIAAAAAARDVAANLLGLEVLQAVPGAELGHIVSQQAPPTNAAPATGAGIPLGLGVVAGQIGSTSAHATWDEGMRCAAATGEAGTAAADLLDAAVLPAPDGRALVALPDRPASEAHTSLVDRDGDSAARATAAASLADVRLFAGSGSEVAVRVISEPVLEVTATGKPESSSVSYHAPLLEISGPGVGSHRLDAPGSHLDLVLPGAGQQPAFGSLPVLAGDDPLEELLDGVRGLAGITSGPESTDPPLELAGLPGVAGTGSLPVLGDVLDDVAGAVAAGELAVLRLSLGDVDQRIDGETVSASAASLRLQLLTWDGGYGGLSAQSLATGVFDLEVGLLQAAATAPAEIAQVPPPATGGCCDEGTGGGTGLALTSTPVRVLVGTGAVLAVTGFLLLAATGRVRRTLIR